MLRLPERLTTRDRINLLAGWAGVDAPTSKRWLEGADVKRGCGERLERAAAELGFTRSPAATEAPKAKRRAA